MGTRAWQVTYKDGSTRLVECAERVLHESWMGFLNENGEPVLIVTADDVRSVEPWVEPPF